jgi:AraC-like DNA-binding protein
LKSDIPTYHLDEINDQTQSLKEVFFTDEKLSALFNLLNKPYRSNYYGLGLCVSGSANLLCNLDSYNVQPNSVITMSPQVIKQWKNVSEDFKTLSIFFTKTFFTKIFSNQNYLEQFQYFDQNTQHVNHFSVAETTYISSTFQNIKTHIKHSHPFQKEILGSYINILLFEYQTLFGQIHFKNNYQQTRSQQLVDTFKNLINVHFKQERSVQFYADKLFITPKYLTEILKQETGRTASEWINELLLLEAKVLLTKQQLQISQIAEALNFPDASTFGKFFKNLASVSPLQYRKTL